MKILVIPDVQAKPDEDFSFLIHIGNYIVAKKPDIVVQIGDFADMQSLSSYDVGTRAFEGRRYLLDINAADHAMNALMAPIISYNELQLATKHKQYKPRLVITLGNHENRISKATNFDSKLDGMLLLENLPYVEYGWEVHPFLERVNIEGIIFSHYFTSGTRGLPISSAQMLLNKKHMSCIAGHLQGRQSASAVRADGKMITAIIAGSCYKHDEDYMPVNDYWRGVIMLHNVQDGSFDECFVPLDYLEKRYG